MDLKVKTALDNNGKCNRRYNTPGILYGGNRHLQYSLAHNIIAKLLYWPIIASLDGSSMTGVVTHFVKLRRSYN